MTFFEAPRSCNFVPLSFEPQVLLYKDSRGKARRCCDSQEVPVEPDAQVQLVLLKEKR